MRLIRIVLSQEKGEVNTDKQAEAPVTLLYRIDTFPLLPAINFDTISPVACRSLLTDYIQAVWGKQRLLMQFRNPLTFDILTEFSLSSEESLGQTPPPPWDALHSAEHRLTLLMDPDSFSRFKSLDPSRMSVTEIYDALNDLSNAQEEDHPLLQFNINDEVVANLISLYSVDQDIAEVPDPSSTTKPKGKKKGTKRGKKKLVSDDDIPDFSLNPNGLPEAGERLSPAVVDQDIAEVTDPSSITKPKGKKKGTKRGRKNLVVSNDDIPDFSPNPNGLPEAGERLSPAVATPTAHGDGGELGLLPEHIIISALQAVATHNGGVPPSGDSMASSPPQHGQKHSRVDAESASEGGRMAKRVRYEEPLSHREATETEAALVANSSRTISKATTPTAGKAVKPKTGAKVSTELGGVTAPAVRRGRKASTTSVTKLPPPPPARVSKRYADFLYIVWKWF